MSKTVNPLYFLNSDIVGPDYPNEYDVCCAAVDVVGDINVRGAQKIRNLWRVYVETQEARVKLMTNGMDISGQHLELLSESPYSFSTKGKSIKINLHDVKIHFTNEYIQNTLKGMGVKITSEVKYSCIRDNHGKLTRFKNGDRYVYAEHEHTVDHPLPQFILLQDTVVKVRHQNQTHSTDVCSKCFLIGHSPWNCDNGYACRVCKHVGHYAGHVDCMYFVHSNPDVYTFGGKSRKNDVISNFHQCQFDYQSKTFLSREQAYQYQKAVQFNRHDIAALILKTSDPYQAKMYSKCIVTDEHWDGYCQQVMYNVCYAAAGQCQEYKDAILSTGEKTLIESIAGEYKWGSGLNSYATLHTFIEKLPGENIAGKVVMQVRETLRKATRPSPVKVPNLAMEETFSVHSDRSDDVKDNENNEHDYQNKKQLVKSNTYIKENMMPYANASETQTKRVPKFSASNTSLRKTTTKYIFEKNLKRQRASSGNSIQPPSKMKPILDDLDCIDSSEFGDSESDEVEVG